MGVRRGLFLLGAVVLLAAALAAPACAVDKPAPVIRFTIMSSSPLTAFTLTPPNAAPADCRSEAPLGQSTVYVCKLANLDVLESIVAYTLTLQNNDIQVRPILIRVYPTMPSVTPIMIDIRDKIFLKNFEYTTIEYNRWLNLDSGSDREDFNMYILTRNLYERMPHAIRDTTVHVVRRWFERALATAETQPYQVVDRTVIAIRQSLLDRAVTGTDSAILASEKINDKIAERRLSLADWFLFKISLNASSAEIDSRRADFCRLYAAFIGLWNAADDDDKNMISNNRQLPGSVILNPDGNRGRMRPFVGCGQAGTS